MKTMKLWIFIVGMVACLMISGLFVPAVTGAGDLEPPPEAVDGSGDPVPTMHTLEDIYTELQEIRQIEEFLSCAEGIEERFCDAGNGTVLDTVTGLIWLKNARCIGWSKWGEAMSFAQNLANGDCGLTDGSAAGSWRLPTRAELQGLCTNPPDTWSYGYWWENNIKNWNTPGPPFVSILPHRYWTSDIATFGDWAYYVKVSEGYTGLRFMGDNVNLYAWPVRRCY